MPVKGLGIYYADQCDKNKCTSIKIFNKKDTLSFPLFWMTKKDKIRRKSLILTPYAKFLLPEDRKIVQTEGITVLDCSWKKNDPILYKKFKEFKTLMENIRLFHEFENKPILLPKISVNVAPYPILSDIFDFSESILPPNLFTFCK